MLLQLADPELCGSELAFEGLEIVLRLNDDGFELLFERCALGGESFALGRESRGGFGGGGEALSAS